MYGVMTGTLRPPLSLSKAVLGGVIYEFLRSERSVQMLDHVTLGQSARLPEAQLAWYNQASVKKLSSAEKSEQANRVLSENTFNPAITLNRRSDLMANNQKRRSMKRAVKFFERHELPPAARGHNRRHQMRGPILYRAHHFHCSRVLWHFTTCLARRSLVFCF